MPKLATKNFAMLFRAYLKQVLYFLKPVFLVTRFVHPLVNLYGVDTWWPMIHSASSCFWYKELVVLRIGKIEIKQLKGGKCRIMTFYDLFLSATWITVELTRHLDHNDLPDDISTAKWRFLVTFCYQVSPRPKLDSEGRSDDSTALLPSVKAGIIASASVLFIVVTISCLICCRRKLK